MVRENTYKKCVMCKVRYRISEHDFAFPTCYKSECIKDAYQSLYKEKVKFRNNYKKTRDEAKSKTTLAFYYRDKYFGLLEETREKKPFRSSNQTRYFNQPKRQREEEEDGYIPLVDEFLKKAKQNLS
jgi:hypothetical protein